MFKVKGKIEFMLFLVVMIMFSIVASIDKLDGEYEKEISSTNSYINKKI